MAKKTAQKKKTTKRVTKTVKKSVKRAALNVVKKTARPRVKKTIVIVKYDCGFNNHLSIRGHGANLSWEHGQALENVKGDEWLFETITEDPGVEFKILINDQVFEIGDNHHVKKGEKKEHHPKFH